MALGYLNQRGVPKLHLNVMGCPPAWMGGCTIAAGREDEFVEMVTSLLYYARNARGLRIDLVSPLNEPDLGGPEGPLVAPDQYLLVLTKLASRLDNLGLGDIRLLGPETADVTVGVSDYLPIMLSDPAIMARVDRFGLHDYSGYAGGAVSAVADSAYPDRAVWVTEFAGPCGACDTGPSDVDEWTTATGMLSRLFSFLDQGVASALVYDAYDSFYEHHGSFAYWGMLANDQGTVVYRPRKQMYAAAHLFRFTEAGMIRIGASSSLPGVTLRAFHDDDSGKLSIVGYNATDTDHTIHGTLANISTTIGHFEAYTTNKTRNLATEADVVVKNGRFVVALPGNTILTLSHAGTQQGQDLHEADWERPFRRPGI